ncbi:ATP-binding protein [Streptomyces sp. CA-288835]|uniref:ATP-binding protein n=1 Tax=Streptomyces sp. CA-288835 TaxID=3240069 RepID=UPI003D8AF1B4
MTIELTLLTRVSYRDREITGPRLRGLLALLAEDLRVGASTARLVDGLWPEEQPENPTKALQVLVSRVRSQLGPDVVVSTATGYRLALAEDQVDSSAVLLCTAEAAAHARACEHAEALARAEAGLALWDGAPAGGSDVHDDPVSALRAARAPAYAALTRARALALSRLGRRAEAVEALARLAGELPRDEEVLLELLRCEADTAGPAAALARYDAYRRRLRDGLGTDPGPALRALHQELLRGEAPVVRHGIPYEPNPLLGRDDDIAAVAGLLRSSRVVSVIGPGGLGKTRLAHAVGRAAEQRVVHFVPLAGVTSDDDVAGEVASALGAGEFARTAGLPTDLLAGIAGALGPSALLILDNCEQVVRGAAELVRALVSTTRDLRVLTTSRAPLGLSSESVYLLPELSLPTTVELFGQRARAARLGVELPAGTVEDLCRHLDGLPLAVELAAARVRVMAVDEIARRLQDRFTLLRGGPRDAPQRHRTLLAVVDWSWHLLEPDGQAALRALSVFPDGFTEDSARQLLGDEDVLEVLEHLVDQSLLKVGDTVAGVRFRMLETVREFSTARREEAGESERVTRQFLAWARDFGRAHHDAAFDAESVAGLERIRAEQDNLLHALRLAQVRDDRPAIVGVAAVLAGLWNIDSSYQRTIALIEETGRTLSHFRPEPGFVEVTRTLATLFASNVLTLQGPTPRALRAVTVLRRLPPAPPDTLVRAAAIVVSGILGPDPTALATLCDSPEPLVAGVANAAESYVREREDDPEGALRTARRMLEAFEPRGTPWMLTMAHARVSELCVQLERGQEARRHLLTALRLQDQLFGTDADDTGVRWALVIASLQLGDIDAAEYWLEQTVGKADEGFGVRMYDLGLRAEVLIARGDAEAGLEVWRRAADPSANADGPLFGGEATGLEPWTLEAEAVTVTAHAQQGRLDLVEGLVRELPRKTRAMLSQPTAALPAYYMDLPVCGALLLALAMVDLDRGAIRSGARLIALAERCRFLRSFQPTMSSARAREAARNADKAAYDDAVSTYAALGRDALRAAALEALREREQGL